MRGKTICRIPRVNRVFLGPEKTISEGNFTLLKVFWISARVTLMRILAEIIRSSRGSVAREKSDLFSKNIYVWDDLSKVSLSSRLSRIIGNITATRRTIGGIRRPDLSRIQLTPIICLCSKTSVRRSSTGACNNPVSSSIVSSEFPSNAKKGKKK